MAPTTGLDLLTLQGNIKRDPGSYAEDFELQFRHYKACLDIFTLKPSEDSQEFADLVTFVAQVSSCYPDRTKDFASDISGLLGKHYAILNSSLRQAMVKALIMMRNRNQISAMEAMPLFFKLFRCQDKTLRQLIFRHIIADIKGANKRSQNDQLNRAVQNFMYSALEDPHEGAAKKSLAVLIELWQRHVWRDARTVNVIAMHKSTRIMIAALKFFLGQDEADPEDSDDDGDDDAPKLVNPSKADVYKATKKGTVSSKKKKAAKLKRVMAAVKKQQRKGTKNNENFAAIQLMHDPQKFAEELFKRLHKSQSERFEVRMAMMSVISRVMGVHKLLLLNFYPFMQKYVLPHQRDAPQILATLVQAVHDEVPPDALTPIMRQLVDQFVHDRARPEVMTLGLKTVRNLCERAPLVMTEELLQDLALYKKNREKEVASSARSLISLFRELAPGMLEKKDRGRDADLQAAPRAFGARAPASRIEGADLLQAALLKGDQDSDEEDLLASEGDSEAESGSEADNEQDGSQLESRESDGNDASDLDEEDAELSEEISEDELEQGAEEEAGSVEASDPSEDEADDASEDEFEEEEGASEASDPDLAESESLQSPGNGTKSLDHADTAKRKREADKDSLSSMRKQLAEAKAAKKAKTEDNVEGSEGLPLEYERILTEEDFVRIRELRHKKLVSDLMRKHGLKSAAKRDRLLAAAEEEAEEALEKRDLRATLGEDRLDPDALIGRHKTRKSKEERLASVMEGREGRAFGAAAARKHKKVGGKSNKEKLKQKRLPMGAKKHIVQRRGQKQRVGPKNFKARARH